MRNPSGGNDFLNHYDTHQLSIIDELELSERNGDWRSCLTIFAISYSVDFT
jgi:hypothetical protein